MKNKNHLSYNFTVYVVLLKWTMKVLTVYFNCRWKLEHCRNFSINCYMWYHTFHTWWPTASDIGSCRTHCYYVHLLVQLCQREGRFGESLVLSLGWMVLPIFIYMLLIWWWNSYLSANMLFKRPSCTSYFILQGLCLDSSLLVYVSDLQCWHNYH